MIPHFGRSSRYSPARSREHLARRTIGGATLNLKAQLWLQAFQDGELTPSQLRKGKTLVTSTAAQSFVARLSSLNSVLAGSELERRVPQNRERYWRKIERLINATEKEADRGESLKCKAEGPIFYERRVLMRTSNQLWRGVACGGLSLLLLSGVGLPISARAATNKGDSGKCSEAKQTHREVRAMRQKMLAEAKAEDAALEKMVAELNKAPESKKVDLEAAILTKLVAQHHERLGEWESLHAQIMQHRKEHMPMANVQNSSAGIQNKNRSASTASK